MRLVDADVLRERVQDYLAAVKTGDKSTDFVIEVTINAVLDLIDTTPTKYVHGKGY